MRLIGAVTNQQEAEKLSAHLKKRGIENSTDAFFDPKDGHFAYQIWVHNEDQIPEAAEILQHFQSNPSSSEYVLPPAPNPIKQQLEPPPPPKRPTTPFTYFMLALCVLVFILNALEQMPLRKEGLSEKIFLLTPIQALFLFELPPPYEKLEEIVEKLTTDEKLEDISPQVQSDLESIEKTPYWRGAYAWLLLKLQGKSTALVEGSFLSKIRQGEIWRTFTPCLLHGNLLHILFNMLWLWVLGRPIEQRIGIFKSFILTVTTGIIPNFTQYLMSGPFFLGYSGIVLGLAGFTWMRERIAPWEGYPLNRSTVLFLLFFIGAMFALQFASFLMQIFTNIPFEPNIANTAHIAGALIGAFLGRFAYFSWGVK